MIPGVVGLCVHAIKFYRQFAIHDLSTALNVYFREVDIITPMVESMWDIERYCLTYKKDGTTYELYDEQQILYPGSVLCGVFVIASYFEARNKPSRGVVHCSCTLVPLATVIPSNSPCTSVIV